LVFSEEDGWVKSMTWRSAVLGLLGIGSIVLVIAISRWYHQEWQVYHGYTPLPFSHESWVTADADTRGHMLDDLLAKHRLKGMTAEEAKTLLGPPDKEEKYRLYYEVGYRGFNSRAPMVFSYTLFIDLNRQGHVEEVYTGD
jgi:hypothetical protein